MTRMELSPKQEKELECVKFFIPTGYDGYSCLDKYNSSKKNMYDVNGVSPVEAFFSKMEKGILLKTNNVREYNKLVSGLRWRGIHIHEAWEPGIREGTTFYCELVEELPECVVHYMAKEIFEGADKWMILGLYEKKCAKKMCKKGD